MLVLLHGSICTTKTDPDRTNLVNSKQVCIKTKISLRLLSKANPKN